MRAPRPYETTPDPPGRPCLPPISDRARRRSVRPPTPTCRFRPPAGRVGRQFRAGQPGGRTAPPRGGCLHLRRAGRLHRGDWVGQAPRGRRGPRHLFPGAPPRLIPPTPTTPPPRPGRRGFAVPRVRGADDEAELSDGALLLAEPEDEAELSDGALLLAEPEDEAELSDGAPPRQGGAADPGRPGDAGPADVPPLPRRPYSSRNSPLRGRPAGRPVGPLSRQRRA
jgi:hypothetical protein